MGWLRDIVRIPDYVADANEEVNYMRELTAIMRIREKPAFNAMRFGGEIVMGWIFGFLARVAIPEELFAEYPSLKFVVDVVIPYASAVGRYHMSSILIRLPTAPIHTPTPSTFYPYPNKPTTCEGRE